MVVISSGEVLHLRIVFWPLVFPGTPPPEGRFVGMTLGPGESGSMASASTFHVFVSLGRFVFGITQDAGGGAGVSMSAKSPMHLLTHSGV
jgi:hypothetical protein